MKFTKYHSIENAYRQKFVDQCHQLAIPEWVALEKIHGCSFSFLVSNGEVFPAKRSSVIGKSPQGIYEFYGCSPVVEKYEHQVLALSKAIGQDIQLVGELYGQGVQKEINYGPKDFIAFDIMLKDGTFMDWETVRSLCDNHNIPTAPELTRGTLEEMLAIDQEFTSKLCSDAAEGLVIKPLTSGALLPYGERPIIKNKSKAFSEKKEKKPKNLKKIPEELQSTFDDFCTYLNHNRLNNVISKLGTITQKDFGKLTGLLVQDALEEFERDGYAIDNDDWKKLSKFAGKEASGVVREDWLNILDREVG